MDRSKTKIEVELVKRERVSDHRSYFTGEAVRTETTGLRRKQLVITQSTTGGYTERTLEIGLYYITNTTFNFNNSSKPMTVPHGLSNLEQERAFRVLESHLDIIRIITLVTEASTAQTRKT